uniref:Kinesin family member 15 n=1 Tax=Nothobranchius pienaari TaxID=704102 RepID=A0A1A8MXY7_9TELE
MNGYNGTIFAYGQTGSGKTFTMLGPSEFDNFTDEFRGVIPRSFEYLFFLINREVEKSSKSKSFLCKCSFIEIYNEQIYDLLDTASASLFLRENIKKGVFVEGAVEKFVNSAAEAYKVLSMGWRNRRVASTSMNRESSRSHAVFSMTLESKESVNECFGETLSTLQFAQRAKLIKNKAVINEDTQGNVKQLQAEVRKLKDQLAQALSFHHVDSDRDAAPGGSEPCMGPSAELQHDVSYKAKLMSAVRLWRKQEDEKKILLKKVAQLEEAWTQKDKFIHSSRMIIRFREEHISRLEKKLKAGQSLLSDVESQALIEQLKKEIKILSDQVDHHPKMTRYAAENYSLREENRMLRSLESVMNAEDVCAQVSAELEEAFQKALESEKQTGTCTTMSSALGTDADSTATIEKLNSKLLQKQSDFTAALQAFEDPEHLNGNDEADIWSEQPPSDMTEMALTEELHQIQEQASCVQTRLDEVELKNSKLLQQIAKLEEQIAMKSQECDHKEELLSAERANRNKDQLNSDCEIHDLRLLLQSSDKELASVKNQLKDDQSEHQQEASQLSNSLISTQLQLDKVQLEWEQLLEQNRTLQDSFDQLQAEAKFDADQAGQQLCDKQQEIEQLKADILNLNHSLQAERERTSSLISQLRENKESTSKELLETMDQNAQLRKQVSDMTAQNHQQSIKLTELEQSLTAASETITSLEQKIKQDKDVLLDLMNQTKDLRSELSQKEETIIHLNDDIRDMMAKYDAACSERENTREQNQKIQTEICELKETLERKMASNKIEVEVLQDEFKYATEEVDRLTKVLGEQNILLQTSQEQTAKKEAIIRSLQQKVQQQQEAVEKTVRNGDFKPPESSVTPKSLDRTPRGFGSFNRNLNDLLESQEQELESRRSSMMSMEVLLAELNAERAAKNEEIHRLKMELTDKEVVQMEIQGLLDTFYIKQSQLTEPRNNSNTSKSELHEAINQTLTCVHELTTELRNRCLELREINQRIYDEEKLLQENELLRQQNLKLSEENGKLVGHKNHKQRIEYLVKLKKENTRLEGENEKLRAEICLMRESSVC